MPNDIAFKVIIKNDGISDIIFKTLMLKGEAGGSISSIEKTSSSGNVDTYTITLNDGTTTTFEVTNGSNIQSIEKTATAGLIDTYTVTLTNGDITTFEVKNGEDAQLYELPQNCVVAYDKEPELHSITGQNGYVAFDAYGVKNVKVTGYTHQKSISGNITWNQLFQNGNFGNGTNNWKIYNTSRGTLTASDNVGTITYNQTLSGGYDCGLTLNGYSIPVETAHKYLFQADVKADFATSIEIEIGTGISNSRRDLSLNEWTRMVWIAQRPSWTTTTAVIIKPTLSTIINGSTLQFKNLQFIDLTMLFDAETADYIYNLEQATAGAGVAYFKNYFPDDYYAYNAGTVTSLPSPDFPQDIIGYGSKELDGTYTIDIEVTDNDDNVYNITASGLAYPLYDGDVLDFENSKVIRAKACLDLSTINWANNQSYANVFNGTLTEDLKAKVTTDILSSKYKYETLSTVTTNDFGIAVSANRYYLYVHDSNFSQANDFKTWLQNNETLAVYSLETPTEESVTISGDTSIVKNLRGWTQVDAWDEDVTLDVWYYSDVDFPDGYEEIDFPLDELLYYQDQEYIEFPMSWGFVMGYVFDASEIRFTMNVTKDLHEGFNVVANKSIDLALNLYTGAGGSNLTGFNFVDASFIREYGQIQIRLKTENPHGLTIGSLLGARVSQGRLRITFEEV